MGRARSLQPPSHHPSITLATLTLGCSVAQAADQELEAAGKPATRLGDCGDQLRKCFAVALQAPGNQGKRLAALDVVNVSIKTYFKLNTLRLCKNLTRTVGGCRSGWRLVSPRSAGLAGACRRQQHPSSIARTRAGAMNPPVRRHSPQPRMPGDPFDPSPGCAGCVAPVCAVRAVSRVTESHLQVLRRPAGCL